MSRSFTVIDSFRLTEELQPRLEGMSLGTWFVLEGQFGSVAELPESAASVVVVTPSGELLSASVAGAEARHGVGAVQLLSLEHLPRLSTLSLAENGP